MESSQEGRKLLELEYEFILQLSGFRLFILEKLSSDI